jgi:hypothetical protein
MKKPMKEKLEAKLEEAHEGLDEMEAESRDAG